MDATVMAMSPEVVRQRSWNISPVFSRDYSKYGYFGRRPSAVLPNPIVVLRRLHFSYIVPLICDFCGKGKPIHQVSVLLWCGECPAADSYTSWL